MADQGQRADSADRLAGRTAVETPVLEVRQLGLVPYREAWAMQEELAAQRGANEISDTLLVLEHPPTYTRGRRTQPGELPHDPEWYAAKGIEIVDIDRGGGVTYHGPGQLVVYPIVDLRPYGVRNFVGRLEQTIVAALADHEVGAGLVEGLTGVWVARGGEAPAPDATAASVAPALAQGTLRKIASIGIHVTRGITTHGLAINVTNDLTPFEWVVPCGIENCTMTSVRREEPAPPRTSAADLGATLARHYAEIFERRSGNVVG